MKKKVIVVDDHPIVRSGFVQLIDQAHDLKVIGQASNARAAMEEFLKKKPDIALVDLSLEDSNGIELIKDMKIQCPDIPVLVVSLHDEDIYSERALRAGARGFIMKAEAVDNVMDAIREVLRGGVYLSDKMRIKLFNKLTGNKIKGFAVDDLSDRELQVFHSIGKGLNTRAIAENLNLSIKTIETYKSHIKVKLDLNNSTELTKRAIEWAMNQS